MIRIDGDEFNIPIISVRRKADFLDKYAERTEDGILHRELIGVYFNYQIQFGTTNNITEYVRLWDKLTEPEEFHHIMIPDTDGSAWSFNAYFSNVSDQYRRVVPDPGGGGGEGEFVYIAHFTGLTVNFISKSPSRS